MVVGVKYVSHVELVCNCTEIVLRQPDENSTKYSVVPSNFKNIVSISCSLDSA